MRYLNENKILLEEPEDELEVIDIEAAEKENQEEDSTEDETDVESSNELEVAEEPVEEPQEQEVTQDEFTQEDEIDSGVSSMINSSIVSTWNRIDEFTSMIATIKSYSNYKDIVAIVQSILDDEMIHVGQLQKALSLVSSSEDLISQGVEKAEEVITSSEIDDSNEDSEEVDEIVDDEEETQSESNTEEIDDVESEEDEETKEESSNKDVDESLVKRCRIKYSKGDDVHELQEMLKACDLKTKICNNYILVEGKVKDIYNASGMIDIPVHSEDLF